MSGVSTRRGVSARQRAEQREEERKLRSRTAYGYAARVGAKLPDRLQELMKASGLSWYGLEQQSGVSREMISKVLRGETKRPSLFLLCRLSYGIRVGVGEFVALLDEWRSARIVPH